MPDYSNAALSKFDASDIATINSRRTDRDINKIIESTSDLQEKSLHIQTVVRMLKYYFDASQSTGGYVNLKDEHYRCPGLVGNDNSFVPLYEFVEVIDESIDYEIILDAFPTLTYSQISGAISFLRKLAQFNLKDIDVDEYLDDEFVNDRELLSELRVALADKETERVLNFD
ncbi:MAG: hypothetical protein HGJ94_19070 [Desulfosarcina sp.]|nr:hypothetical protein [Desulfosarcina sp.]